MNAPRVDVSAAVADLHETVTANRCTAPRALNDSQSMAPSNRSVPNSPARSRATPAVAIRALPARVPVVEVIACRFTPWSGLPATGAVSLLLAQGGEQGSFSGLLQRLLVTLIAAWAVAVAWRVRSLVRPRPTSTL
ncbi:hypothetical protein SAMN05421812_12377 [Asanoa hainanensis]|uniref:Uncharacterized protein n=1 Tax=Asanoa hainanensis TaxID=560556 RepID=A0A239PFZ4_9ACTN|nr:hypothetical protein [Asanoa hainanensis]SNT65524.1 hypothetical protein SAMN05421812_12377 [Asanoa hainanensis]